MYAPSCVVAPICLCFRCTTLVTTLVTTDVPWWWLSNEMVAVQCAVAHGIVLEHEGLHIYCFWTCMYCHVFCELQLCLFHCCICLFVAWVMCIASIALSCIGQFINHTVVISYLERLLCPCGICLKLKFQNVVCWIMNNSASKPQVFLLNYFLSQTLWFTGTTISK